MAPKGSKEITQTAWEDRWPRRISWQDMVENKEEEEEEEGEARESFGMGDFPLLLTWSQLRHSRFVFGQRSRSKMKSIEM